MGSCPPLENDSPAVDRPDESRAREIPSEKTRRGPGMTTTTGVQRKAIARRVQARARASDHTVPAPHSVRPSVSPTDAVSRRHCRGGARIVHAASRRRSRV